MNGNDGPTRSSSREKDLQSIKQATLQLRLNYEIQISTAVDEWPMHENDDTPRFSFREG